MLSILAILFSVVEPVPEKQPADFVAYVEQIRAAGATEAADADLFTTAGIVVGQDVIEFPKDENGNFGTRYSSTTCPPPGLSAAELARWNEDQSKQLMPALVKLKRIADTDHSGFVSTDEGSRLRSEFETGLRIVWIAHTETLDQARLRTLLEMDEKQFREALEKYQTIVKALGPLPNVSLPAVPPELKLNARAKPGA